MWQIKLGNPTSENVRTVRARQHADGHFEFLQAVHIQEKEFDVVVVEPASTDKLTTRQVKLSPAWNMGSVGVVAREHLYDELG
jgi:hypothetical protein